MIRLLASAVFAAVLLGFACGDDSAGPIQGEEGWQQITSQDITLEWRVVEDSLEIVVSAPTTGWVSAGFNPSQQMNEADILIGYVSASGVRTRDDWGTGRFAHQSDESLGGTDNIASVSGEESDGKTSVAMTRPLDSGDVYDKPLEQGETCTVILAHGRNGADDFSSRHQAAAVVSIEL